MRLAPPARVRAAIGSLLGEVFAEQSDFELHPERVNAALERLNSTALVEQRRTDGRRAARRHDDLERRAAARPRAHDRQAAGARRPAARSARAAARTVRAPRRRARKPGARRRGSRSSRGARCCATCSRALRLFGDGRVTLGPLGWARIGLGPWTPLPLGAGGRPHGMLIVTVEQEDELRAFCNLVSRRAPRATSSPGRCAASSSAASAPTRSRRSATTCSRCARCSSPRARRAASSQDASRRCARRPSDASPSTERAVQAVALERAAIAGTAATQPGARLLAEEIADHLRALMRDVICGHLDADLVGLADELLLADRPVEPEPERYEPFARPRAGVRRGRRAGRFRARAAQRRG